MTLHDFSADVVPILTMLISLAGMIGLYLVWCQIKQTNSWNKINTQHTLLSDLPTEEQEKRFLEIYRGYKSSSDVTSKENAAEIYNDLDKHVCIKTVLNKYEHLCAAINAKTIDDDYAYSVHSARVIGIFKAFEQYIVLLRDKDKDLDIYLELEKVATLWLIRYHEEENKRQAQIQQFQAARGAASITRLM